MFVRVYDTCHGISINLDSCFSPRTSLTCLRVPKLKASSARGSARHGWCDGSCGCSVTAFVSTKAFSHIWDEVPLVFLTRCLPAGCWRGTIRIDEFLSPFFLLGQLLLVENPVSVNETWRKYQIANQFHQLVSAKVISLIATMGAMKVVIFRQNDDDKYGSYVRASIPSSRRYRLPFWLLSSFLNLAA